MKLAEIKIQYSAKHNLSDRPVMNSSTKCAEVVRSIIDSLGSIEHREYVILIPTNRKLIALGWYLISAGGINCAMVDPKVVFQVCLKSNASGFVLAHNHPSGAIEPSKSDNYMTSNIKKLSLLHEMDFVDHIIVTSKSHYSYSDEGTLY